MIPASIPKTPATVTLGHPHWTEKNRRNVSIQLRAKETAHLVNKHYQNEVILTGQNPPLKYCQPLEILTQFEKVLDLLVLKI